MLDFQSRENIAGISFQFRYFAPLINLILRGCIPFLGMTLKATTVTVHFNLLASKGVCGDPRWLGSRLSFA